MCGIAGGWLGTGAQADEAIARMLAAIAHRGPDDQSHWSGDGLTLGHRRLSILDLSPAGRQPMASVSGRFVLVFNGEIYNHADLRARLESAGHAPALWRGHSDTEILLACVEAWGFRATLHAAVGMWAMALWDRERRTLQFARDRLGEKPLYFAWPGGTFAFASEPKALQVLPGWTARADGDVLARYLQGGYVPGTLSAFRGVYRLPPGGLLSLGDDDLRQPPSPEDVLARIESWWSIEAVARAGLAAPFEGDFASAGDELESLLSTAIGRQMMADVPVGAFLSGGVDSSTVVALMQKLARRPVRTFSIGFADRAYDEAPHARAVAAHLGTDHEELYVSPDDALACIPALVDIFDEPFADQSMLPTLLVSRLARRSVTVSLSGDGGDELFGGYGRYAAIESLWRAGRPFGATGRRLAASGLRAVATLLPARGGAASPAFRLARLAERFGGRTLDDMRMSFIGGAEALRADGRADASTLAGADVLRRLMYADQRDYLPDDILVKLDRTSMSTGLESRVPLLDPSVVDFSWRLPRAYLDGDGKGKRVLRAVLARHVPLALTERPKQGFAPPVSDWLRGPLRPWAESLIAPDRLRELPMIDAAATTRLWQRHLCGELDAGYALWKVLMLVAWRDRFNALV